MKRKIMIEVPCTSCGSTKNPHKAKGECDKCYARKKMARLRLKWKKEANKKAKAKGVDKPS